MPFPSYLKHFQDSGNNLFFLDIEDSLETQRDNSYTNHHEIDLAISILTKVQQCLWPVDLPSASLGFITPYKQQAIMMQHKVNASFPQAFKDILQVNTIDSFQGQEKDLIIISTVRAGRGNIGFLADDRRMNVALTRAKFALLVIGNAKTLCCD